MKKRNDCAFQAIVSQAIGKGNLYSECAHVEEMKRYTGNTTNGVSCSDDELWKMLEKERDDYNEAQDAAKFL